MKKIRVQRYAFTLIELIFAIVIISIAVVSLPMMTQATSKAVENNIVQEAIFSASAELFGATAGYWDKNSAEDIENNKTSLSRVIDLNGDCDSNRLRPGHINQSYHRKCLDSNTTTAADINDSVYKNLDNAEHLDNAGNSVYEDIFLDTTGATTASSASGYKTIYQSKVDVNRNDNNKTITIYIKPKGVADNDFIVKLKLISTNIGEIDYYKRRMY